MQIVPNVFLVCGFPYGEHQNSYIVRLGNELVLIDSGDSIKPSFDLVQKNCLPWGLRLDQVSHFLITHSHFDHSSHAARMQAMGAKIVTNRDGAEALATGDDRCIGYALHRRFEPCRADLVVKDGDEIQIGTHTIRCIEAPGHANSCVVYEIVLNGQILLFVGDIILTGSECATVELGWGGGPDYDHGLYLKTLHRLCHMPCDNLCPGHGPPGLGNGRIIAEMAYTKAMSDRH